MNALALSFCLAACAPSPPLSDVVALESRLNEIAKSADGRLGVCSIASSGETACVNGDHRFSLQSVMKLIVGAAAFDAADRGELRLEDATTIRPQQLSVNVQPLADIVRRRGKLTTTWSDLIFRAVAQSDSAATDVIIDRLGGPAAVQAFLNRRALGGGIRIDRDERHLQTETTGLEWRAEYVDPRRLTEASERLSPQQRRAAFAVYLTDKRDTATPRAMAIFLRRLADGSLLSSASTRGLLTIMRQTRTFPTRLRAGVPGRWSVAHKTGTSGSMDGLNGVTNDVGILTSPGGATFAVAAFYAESRSTDAHRDATLAACAAAIANSLITAVPKGANE